MGTESPYKYRTLDSPDLFRILRLEPGRRTDPLKGRIITHSLDDDIQYDAISYVWGSDETVNTLETPDGSIALTASMSSALRAVRWSTSPHLIWADSISINQSDKHEKGVQVRHMGRIYRKAQTVLAHLGEEADESQDVYALFCAIYKQHYSTLLRVLRREEAGSESTTGGAPGFEFPPLSTDQWAAFWAFFRRPWFRRLWIVQEVAVAKEVRLICGDWSVGWHMMEEVMEKFRTYGIYPLVEAAHLSPEERSATRKGLEAAAWVYWIRGSYKRRIKMPLWQLAWSCRAHSATEARDHFFALQELADDGALDVFRPDYETHLEAVIRRFAAQFVSMGYGRELIKWGGLYASPSRLLSWAPDWTQSNDGWMPLSYENGEYYAAKNISEDFSASEDSGILQVRGVLFDTLVKTGRPCKYDRASHQSLSTHVYDLIGRLKEADEMITELSSYPSGCGLDDVYWRALIADRGDYYVGPDMYALARETLTRLESTDVDLDEKILEQDPAWPYIKLLLDYFGYWNFCVTNRGYVGLVPEGSREGDTVAIIHGMGTVYIIRKEDNDLDCFQVIGQSHIEGIMHGEGIDLAQGESTKFLLR